MAAITLVILLQLDSNRRLFGMYDLSIAWMTSTSKTIELFYTTSIFVSYFKVISEFKLEL